ncbi:MAG: MBL fold metallo-hydrolase [Ruminococcaceae bacterium]|nr:MBL fold metallo-hydrolase [Oscillospiraceae bacterium]
MLHIDTLVVGDYQVNCYIVRKEGESRCIVIDPGYEADGILAFLKAEKLCLEAILLTHGHFDHVGAVKELVAQTHCRVFVDAQEDTMPLQLTAGPLYRTDEYASQFEIAGLQVSVLHTPGHTPGSVCLMIEDALFSGDTLFAGSCGRTDLPGGDWVTIQKSLAALQALEGNYRVFPGHGEPSTLEMERQYNPYL